MRNRIQIANAEVGFDCASEDTILSGGLRAGVGLPHECLSGGCGKCYFDLVGGEVDVLWPEAPGLSPRARERGRLLACQTRPRGDCVIKRSPAANFVPPILPARREATLVGSRTLAPGMAEFTVKTSSPAEFLPGQFCLLTIPGVEGRRAYSMSNLPNGEGRWDFIVRRVPGGAATSRLFDRLADGSEIGLDGPYGHAYLRPDVPRDIVCIAGGSGLSPILSIARGAVRAGDLSDRRISVFYGGRGPRDICVPRFWDEDPLLRSRAECHTAISDPTADGADGWDGYRGYIHEVVDAVLTDRSSDCEFYVCGPAPMVEAVQEMLTGRHNIPRERLHFDSFF